MSDRSIGDDRTSAGQGGNYPPSSPRSDSASGGERSIGEGLTQGQAVPSADHAPGTVIDGRFEIVGLLGRGGMGQVYRARDRRLSRQVALKRLLGAGALNAKARERFDREARSVAGLTHPGIVALYDYGVDEHGPYFVMELLEGADLSSWVKQSGPMPAPEVLRVAREICRALDYAHGRGIVHRDLKPSNLFRLPDGTIKLLDFGLARVEEDAGLSQPQLSVVGLGMGTADYAAPEQREDASRADARSDIYSLGATLYFLATGRSPRVMSEKYLPSELRVLVLQLVEEHAADRPANVAEAVKLFAASEARVLPAPATVEVKPTTKPACPRCQASVPQEAKFCVKCGYSFKTRCRQCKAEMSPEADFCGECGSKRTDAETGKQLLSQAFDVESGIQRDGQGKTASDPVLRYKLPETCEVLEEQPDPKVVTDDQARERMKATGLPWWIRQKATGIELLLCPPGEFMMGSPETEVGRSPNEVQHRRQIRAAFYVGRTQVTQGQWQRVMGSNPSHVIGTKHPVTRVSWNDCSKFCQQSGFRLPSEAQWEYACRAGTQTRFSCGDSEKNLHDHAVLPPRGILGALGLGGKLMETGNKAPNPWGLLDMHGNAWEWCEDTYGAYPSAGDEQPASGGEYRVIRGGSWYDDSYRCRSAFRLSYDPGSASSNVGFRVVLAPVLVK